MYFLKKLRAIDDEAISSIDFLERYAYGTCKDLMHKKEETYVSI